MAYQLPCAFDETEFSPQLDPPLKWAGGKRWLVPLLRTLYHPYREHRLVEPFVGGMSVALGLSPTRALLSDINPHLINLFRHLKKGLEIKIPLKNERLRFYAARRRFNRLIELKESKSSEAAQLFYYLNRTCFNGLCRFNSKGFFNVPFGQYRTISYRRDFLPYRIALKHWTFKSQDFATLAIDNDDFVYLDPPYDVEFTRYAKEDFTWEDQERLAAWAAKLPCPVVASNQATDRIVRLYKKLKFKVRIVNAPRMIACNGDRSPAREILATINL